jgi:hypothetical protein
VSWGHLDVLTSPAIKEFEFSSDISHIFQVMATEKFEFPVCRLNRTPAAYHTIGIQ